MHAAHARWPADHEFRRQREAGEDRRAPIRTATPIQKWNRKQIASRDGHGAAHGQDLGEANAKYRVSSPRQLPFMATMNKCFGA